MRSDLTIGKLSTATGVKIETIRYYERIGLMLPAPRTQGGHRVYDNDHMRRLVFLRRSRELGFTIEDIRALLDLVAGGQPCGEVRALTLKHLANVRSKLADLNKLETVLADIAARCKGGDAPDCPIIEALNVEN